MRRDRLTWLFDRSLSRNAWHARRDPVFALLEEAPQRFGIRSKLRFAVALSFIDGVDIGENECGDAALLCSHCFQILASFNCAQVGPGFDEVIERP